MNVYSAIVETAHAFDNCGLYVQADKLGALVRQAADIAQMLQDVPGATYFTNPVNLSDTALGNQMGLTILPNRAFTGEGPEDPLEMPQMRPGMTQEQIDQMMMNWYNSPQTQAWLKSRSSRIKAYADYIHNAPGISPQVREELYAAMMAYAQDMAGAGQAFPNNYGTGTYQSMPDAI